MAAFKNEDNGTWYAMSVTPTGKGNENRNASEGFLLNGKRSTGLFSSPDIVSRFCKIILIFNAKFIIIYIGIQTSSLGGNYVD